MLGRRIVTAKRVFTLSGWNMLEPKDAVHGGSGLQKSRLSAMDTSTNTGESANCSMRSNVEVRGDAPLFGAASLSTDGLCNGG